MEIHLVGYLSPVYFLTGTIAAISQNLEGNLSSFNQQLTGSLSAITQQEIEMYNGKYTAIPLAYEDQILRTKGKGMANNVTITSVPYYETSNLSGGYTVYIAEDSNG